MSRQEKTKRARKPSPLRQWWAGIDPQRRRTVTWTLLWGVLAGGAIAAAGAGMKVLERHVLSSQPQRAVPIQVVLANPPAWMPQSVVGSLAASLLPRGANFNDLDLTARVYALARQQPWFRQVHGVSKRLGADGRAGEVEIQATFRSPIALAHADRGIAQYIDADGVVLPADQVAKWVALVPNSAGELVRQGYYIDFRQVPPGTQAGKLHYILVQGVAAQAPAPGRPWPGDDLAEGLQIVRLLLPKDYARQVTTVDVSNYNKRRDRLGPEIRWLAQVGEGQVTEIRFGRLPLGGGGDIVIPPERKMAYLDEYVANHHGTLAGLNKYIDLRYDKLCFSIR